MRFHDIVSHEDGWSYHVDGVLSASYPSWFLALNAARRSAEQDGDKGIDCSVRFQSMDGSMLPVQTRGAVDTATRFAPRHKGAKPSKGAHASL